MVSKQLLVWVCLYFGGLAGSLIHPIYPLVSYMVFYYAPPLWNWWGDALPEWRYSLMAAGAMSFSLLSCQGGLSKITQVKNLAAPWFLLFGANALVVSMWAIAPERNWEWLVHLLKLIILYFLLPAVIRNRQHFDLFVALHVVGATYWGWKAWDDPRSEGGRLLMVGGPDTLSDNAAAGHLLTVLPFCVLFVLTAERRWVKGLAAVSAGFILNTFILCNSRGATVGFLVAGMMAILLAGRQRRTRLMGFGAAGLVAMFLLADPQFIERQQTTVDATDGAARSRWIFWRAGVEMVRDNPLGVGARGFHALSPRYIGGYLEVNEMEERSGHNTYTQLAVAWGVQGTLIYLIFMLSTARLLHRVRRRATADPWYFNRSLAVEVALAGTMAAAFFSNRLYGESIYWMCSLAFALYRIQATELETATEPAPVSVMPPDRVPAFASALSTTPAMKGS